MNLDHNTAREPTCFVLFVPALGEAYGPFETADDGTLWASERLPDRMMFTALPVFDTIAV